MDHDVWEYFIQTGKTALLVMLGVVAALGVAAGCGLSWLIGG
jgi:hypothetical protein